MARRLHTPEQIIRKLAPRPATSGRGMDLEEVCGQLKIAEATWAGWLNQYGGMKADNAKRLKDLEGDRLKKLVAEAELDQATVKELAEGYFCPVLVSHLAHEEKGTG